MVNAIEQPLHEIKGSDLVYHWHPGQKRVLASKARFPTVLAGSQGGKTVLTPRWLHGEIDRTAKDNELNDYIAVTANYDLFKLKLLPEMLNYFVYTLGIGKYWAGDRVIELAEGLIRGNFKAKGADDPNMWGRIILRSAEAPAGLESATAKAAVLDEVGHPDFKRIAWEAVQRRLAVNQGRALLITSLYEFNWLKIEVYDRWLAGDTEYDIIQFDSKMNPTFPEAEYDRLKRVMPGWKFDLLHRGMYSRPAGVIYDCFDEQTCKVKRFKIPKEWPRYTGHDFGPVHTSALWYAHEPATGYLFLYRTYLTQEKRTAAQNVGEWKRLSGEEPIRKRVGGAGGSQAADEGWRQAYALAGWPISEPLVASVEVGIDKVYAWHKTNRLFIFDDQFDYLSEKLSYSRELDDMYNPTDKIKNKAIYHLMDGERYLLSDFAPVDVVRPTKEITGLLSVRF